MAVRADVLVDLEAALELRIVVGPERRAEAPALMRDLRCVIVVRLLGPDVLRPNAPPPAEREQRRPRPIRGEAPIERASSQAPSPRFRCSHVARARARRLGRSWPSTDSVMLPGSARGRSIKPTTGMTTRKKAK